MNFSLFIILKNKFIFFLFFVHTLVKYIKIKCIFTNNARIFILKTNENLPKIILIKKEQLKQAVFLKHGIDIHCHLKYKNINTFFSEFQLRAWNLSHKPINHNVYNRAYVSCIMYIIKLRIGRKTKTGKKCYFWWKENWNWTANRYVQMNKNLKKTDWTKIIFISWN